MKISRKFTYRHRLPIVIGSFVSVLLGAAIFSWLPVNAVPGNVLNSMIAASVDPAFPSISPNPEAFVLYRTNPDESWFASQFNPPGCGAPYSPGSCNHSSGKGFKHVLKNERSSYVNELVLLAYFPTQAAAQGASFRVNSFDRCGFNAPNGSPDSLQLRINNSLVFNESATASASNATCSGFNTTYSVPAGSVSSTPDPATGYYVVKLQFNLTGPRRANFDQGQQVRFQVRATNNGLFGLEANTDSTQFGIVEAFGDDNGHGIAAAVPFGLACNESNKSFVPLRVYDSDIATFGPMYLSVWKRPDGGGAWVKLTRGEYDIANKVNLGQWDSTNLRWPLTGASGTEASIPLVSFQKTFDYVLVIDNPYNSNFRSPTGNVLSLSVPGQTINASFSCDYNLIPTIEEPTIYGTFLGDANFPVVGQITNRSAGVDNDDHQWQLSQIVMSDKPANLGPAINGQAPCTWQSSGCSVFSGNAGTQSGGFKSPFSRTGTYTQNNVPVGTWICFMMSVRGPTPGSNQWSHSALHCKVAGLQPRVEIWGHDARVLGTTDTSITDQISGATHQYFGSWGQYGIFSSGINNNTSSGLGIARGVNNSNQNAWSSLTFGNVDGGGLQLDEFGNYTNLFDNTPQYDPPYTPAPPGNNFTANNGQYRDYGPGTRAIYDMRGQTARISANIRYTGQYDWIADIPTVVIMADDIVIDDNVRQIDAILIANRITTCRSIGFTSFESARLRANSCQTALQFNSPVYVKQLYLFRTGGNNTNAAETFNMRGDVFMAAFGARVDMPAATTDVITELPPRF